MSERAWREASAGGSAAAGRGEGGGGRERSGRQAAPGIAGTWRRVMNNGFESGKPGKGKVGMSAGRASVGERTVKVEANGGRKMEANPGQISDGSHTFTCLIIHISNHSYIGSGCCD